jgi:hypothetical protein
METLLTGSGHHVAMQSAISCRAIVVGAIVMAASTIVLVLLASGLGLASVSPWQNSGSGVAGFTIMTGIAFIVVQWLSAGIGGYLTGRLRTSWTDAHTHEVFFRDTANGFIAWALMTVVGAIFVASAASSVVGSGTRAASMVAAGAAQGAGQAAMMSANAYDVDSLFRTDRVDPTSDNGSKAEITRIFASGLRNGDVSEADQAYIVQTVARKTGLTQAEAQKRVDGVVAREKQAELQLRQAADTARKTASIVSIFTALSMLIGAFIAAAAAAFGGSLRDEHDQAQAAILLSRS